MNANPGMTKLNALLFQFSLIFATSIVNCNCKTNRSVGMINIGDGGTNKADNCVSYKFVQSCTGTNKFGTDPVRILI